MIHGAVPDEGTTAGPCGTSSTPRSRSMPATTAGGSPTLTGPSTAVSLEAKRGGGATRIGRGDEEEKVPRGRSREVSLIQIYFMALNNATGMKV